MIVIPDGIKDNTTKHISKYKLHTGFELGSFWIQAQIITAPPAHSVAWHANRFNLIHYNNVGKKTRKHEMKDKIKTVPNEK